MLCSADGGLGHRARLGGQQMHQVEPVTTGNQMGDSRLAAKHAEAGFRRANSERKYSGEDGYKRFELVLARRIVSG